MRQHNYSLVMKRLFLLSCVALIGSSCVRATPVLGDAEHTQTQAAEVVNPAHAEVQTTDPPRSDMQSLGLTYIREDGNRFVEGRGNLQAAVAMDISLDGVPEWVVGAASSEGSVWVAVLEDGRVQGFHVIGNSIDPVEVRPSSLPPGKPPVLVVDEEGAALLTSGEENDSALSHAVPLDGDLEAIAFITPTGEVAIEIGDESAHFLLDALPDARLLVDEAGRVLFLSDPTTQYSHGVLGDPIEAGSISLMESSPSPRFIKKFEIGDGRVVEGISPIWADLDGDAVREIVVTESDKDQGARIVVYSEGGERVSESAPIGRGFRWRHQLAIAPFGPEGEIELAAVLTPHIGGIVEFFQLRGEELIITAQVHGYSSHILGSRNLDRAVAGDFDGEGSIELVVPDQGQELLGAIRRTSDGAEVVWSIPIGDRLATNLSAVTMPDGSLALGAGREDGILRLWITD